MDDTIRARVRLWLRAEQALGAGRFVHAGRRNASGVGAAGARAPAEHAAPPPARAASSAPQAPTLFAAAEGDLAAPAYSRQEKIALLAELDAKHVKPCRKCVLCQQRRTTVFGEGDVDAALFFIGEGPGEEEDRTGRPFVGRAGKKLDEMIAAMGLRREQVYIGNVVKCRPPGNRTPEPGEMATCVPYLIRQLEIIRPKVIVLLGATAVRGLLEIPAAVGSLRGQWRTWRGIKVMITYHPAFLVRTPTLEARRAVWSDLQKVMAELGLKNPRAR